MIARVTDSNHNVLNKSLSKNLFMTFKLYHIYDKVESVMMNLEFIFDDINGKQAWWVSDSETEASDLAGVADAVLDSNISLISVPCDATGEIWPWVEKNHIKIVNRFDFVMDKDSDVFDKVSDLAKSINSAFKAGAVGAQVFIHAKDVSDFCKAMKLVRQDLFFDKTFSIAIDIDEMRGQSWTVVFDALREIAPDAILITAKGDSFDANSDFVGIVFDMLNNWNLKSDLHLWFGKNMFRVSQVLRLCQKIQPDLVQNMRVFTGA